MAFLGKRGAVWAGITLCCLLTCGFGLLVNLGPMYKEYRLGLIVNSWVKENLKDGKIRSLKLDEGTPWYDYSSSAYVTDVRAHVSIECTDENGVRQIKLYRFTFRDYKLENADDMTHFMQSLGKS